MPWSPALATHTLSSQEFPCSLSKHPVAGLFTFQCPCDSTCSSSGKEKSEELNINICVRGPRCLPAPDCCLSKCYPEVSVATKEHSFHFLLPDMKLELAVLRNRTNRLPSFCLSLHVVLEGSSASAEFWWVVSMEDAMWVCELTSLFHLCSFWNLSVMPAVSKRTMKRQKTLAGIHRED